MQLSKLLNDNHGLYDESFSHHHQYTQTDQIIYPEVNQQSMYQKCFGYNEVNSIYDSIHHNKDNEDNIVVNEIQSKITLEEKIEVFKKKFIEDIEESENNGNSSTHVNQIELEQLYHKSPPKRLKRSPQQHTNNAEKHQAVKRSCSACSPSTDKMLTLVPEQSPLHKTEIAQKPENSNINDFIDEIDVELARMFSDEKTELDELFGIDPNGEPDDPQICSILKEIENATINIGGHNDTTKALSPANKCHALNSSTIHASHEFRKEKTATHRNRPTSDLSKSIWPCELFMLRRKLSESLAYLVDEDYRWLDIMKLQFNLLFGEDSDDEFATYSPSIELDDILIGSCMRRISPWVVKHLMKPLKDGLIGNKFLFKKLAKHLAHFIIMENQYPGVLVIK